MTNQHPTATPRTELRDRENGTTISLYIAGSGKPHILTSQFTGALCHFEPSKAQLRKLRDGIDALLAVA